MKNFFLLGNPLNDRGSSLAILLLRVFIGVLMMTHGWQKIQNFEAFSQGFMDPIGLGAKLSLILVIAAEFFASIFVILGLLTRLSLLPLIFAMGVAFFIAHAADPFQQKELALIYFGVYIVLFLLGPGKYSLDQMLLDRFLKPKI
ncbi:MAG: DoxX family protein [Bacteroidia bacterium]|jgi:putative oxidoreductase|uniref:DoxX family protein n=1 Tax=bioreactor metagenome TaxID=1076179 RepID=A0A644ZM67_9ZZZZ|nr:DoxX family protein [Rikenellaceae bacterium]NCB18224.1 DoxX family protein [Bacteroidia bacterium]